MLLNRRKSPGEGGGKRQLWKKNMLNSEILRHLYLIPEFENNIPIAFAQYHMDQAIYTTIISMDFKLILKESFCKCKDQMSVLW